MNVMQMLIDAGINAFAAELLVESYLKHPEPRLSIGFPLKGVAVWLGGAEEMRLMKAAPELLDVVLSFPGFNGEYEGKEEWAKKRNAVIAKTKAS